MRILTAAVLLSGLVLAGCDSFDPLDKIQEWDIMSSKTPLKGDRRAVFPEGVPGVPQGVPPELTKGYQAPPDTPPPVVEAKPAAKPKPKPKKVAAPRNAPAPADAQPMRQAPAQATTTTESVPGGGSSMQPLPGAQPTWPSGAQPVPTR